MTPVAVQQGDSPVILGMPHGGTFVPEGLGTRLNATGRARRRCRQPSTAT